MRFSDLQAEQFWRDKYTFFWYNAPEIFHWSQDDFDKKALEMHRAGITRVMTFSITHFRFCFRPFWPQIVETIGKIVKACHKYGIKVVEHSSSLLVYLPKDAVEWDSVKNNFKLHFSSFDDFPGFEKYIMSDPELIPGIHQSDLYQIDGSTGLPAETPYKGRAFCCNNPHYRQLYTEHLHAIASQGVDAILADDIQLFGAFNACTCKYCRALFKEQTGFDLPQPDEWKQFFKDYSNPAFNAWLRFRKWSTRDYQLYLSRKYQEWGLTVYRPNYCSRQLAFNFTANTFGTCLECWEHIFQENCLSQIIKISWPEFYTEALQMYSIGRRKNVPSMSLFYPFRYDQYYFSWALAQSWGQMAFPCPEGLNMLEEDKFFNSFEQKYADAFRNQQKDADCAFLVSRETFDYAPGAVDETYFPLNSLMQASYFAHIQADVVNEDEDIEAFERQRCIVVVGVSLVSDELLKKLLACADNGGTLLIYGEFATFSPPVDREKLINHPNTRCISWPFKDETFQRSVWSYRLRSKMPQKTAPSYVADFLKNGPGRQLREQLPRSPRVESVTPGFHAELFDQKKDSAKKTLHILDMRNLLVPEGTPVSHDDLLEHFCKDAPPLELEIEVCLNCTDVSSVKLFSPSTDKELLLVPEEKDGKVTIRIPAGSFSGYAAVELVQS